MSTSAQLKISEQRSKTLIFQPRLSVGTMASPDKHTPLPPIQSQIRNLPTTELSIPFIASVCNPIFEKLKLEFPYLAWVGVFGSVSRGTQRPDSDIDFLVGHNTGADLLRDLGGSMNALTEALPEALGREVDIVHVIQGNPRGYVQLEGLLTSKTIWGDPSWPAEDQKKAIEVLRDVHVRFSKAALIYREGVKAKLPPSSEEFKSPNNRDVQEVILSNVIEIMELIRLDNSHPIDGSTRQMMGWLLRQEKATRNLVKGERQDQDEATLDKLWTSLSNFINGTTFGAMLGQIDQTFRRASIPL